MSMETPLSGELAESSPKQSGTTAVSKGPLSGIDWSSVVRTPAFMYGVAFIATIFLCLWPLFRNMPKLWFDPETYYSHGPLIPFIAGYLIFDKWDSLKKIQVKPFYVALLPLLVLLYVNYVALSSPRNLLMSVVLIFTLLLGVLFVAGWKWMFALSPAILYLLFGLPVWDGLIDAYTQPLQNISTTLSFKGLEILQYKPYRGADMTILTNNFQMFVGVPCSGLRTVLAVIALTCMLIAIGKLNWKANLFLAVLAIPLAVFANGLRITLIGIVGETFGQDAGHTFHDYSGYIVLVILVFAMYQIARKLGFNR